MAPSHASGASPWVSAPPTWSSASPDAAASRCTAHIHTSKFLPNDARYTVESRQAFIQILKVCVDQNGADGIAIEDYRFKEDHVAGGDRAATSLHGRRRKGGLRRVALVGGKDFAFRVINAGSDHTRFGLQRA